MADADQDQRTEPATAKKRGEAFAKGQFARSPDIQVAFILTTALLVLMIQGPGAAQTLRDFTAHSFRHLGSSELTTEALLLRCREALDLFLGLILPLLLSCAVAAIAAGGLQTRFQLTTEVLGFKPDRLNFVNGLKNIFSANSLMTMPFDLLKFAGIGVALWLAVRRILEDPLFHTPMEAGYLAVFLNKTILLFLGWICGAMAIIATASYSYQHYKTEKDLRMTKQEVKDEHRQQEGDPMIKGKRRSLARRLLQKQMLAAVPTADVVVTNPTHYAVALRYERGKDSAPVILAKGENRLARRIREIAQEHGVPVIENKPVARMLYKIGEVGEPIPAMVFQAVAEILAFVYRTHRYYFHTLKARRAAAAATGQTG